MKLDGIAGQVDQDLAQTARIAHHRFRYVSGDLTDQLQAFLLALPASVRMAPPTACASSNSATSSSICPASILEKSSMSLITVSSLAAEDLTIPR